jgi:hypothetical protein
MSSLTPDRLRIAANPTFHGVVRILEVLNLSEAVVNFQVVLVILVKVLLFLPLKNRGESSELVLLDPVVICLRDFFVFFLYNVLAVVVVRCD